MKRLVFLVLFLVLAVLVGGGYFLVKNNSQFLLRFPMFGGLTVKTFEINLPANLSRLDIARIIARELNWTEADIEDFASVYTQMQWMEFSPLITDLFTSHFSWSEVEQEVFLINSTRYFVPEFDFMSTIYLPGTYTISEEDSKASISGLLIDRIKISLPYSDLPDFLEQRIFNPQANRVADLMNNALELLPDLAPLPAEDLRLRQEADQVFLAFTTVYYNQGRGPLELIADPATANVSDDIERKVYQRIYNSTGGYRDHLAGIFLWHNPHLHYHFADFILYNLEAIDAEISELGPLADTKVKTTFCIRDVSHISPLPTGAPEDAAYKICGKERQGISVGWADSYFYNYPDQSLNITSLSSGIYRLTFLVNPENSFEEINKDNNLSSVTFRLDMEKMTIEILGQLPFNNRTVEHIYREQTNCSNCTL